MEEKVDLMTQEEVGAYLHCSTHHVTHMRQAGLIKGMKFGKRWLYVKNDIIKFVVKSIGKDYSNFRELSSNGLKKKYNV